jgi:LDH2 family malate/lactate/ureidoglycolate dehydrogenase
MQEALLYGEHDLKDYVRRFFEHFHVPEEDAAISADVIIEADLRGIASHGISKLYQYYGNRLEAGRINTRSKLEVLRETPTAVSYDGGNGIGHVLAYRAMEACILKAKGNSVGISTVRNSNHFGIAGYYAMMALEHRMIGGCLTNSEALVAPTFGKVRLLGTNPIAVAVPAVNRPPVVLDMATSIKPLGQVLLHELQGRKIPLGWGMDRTGKITDVPGEIHQGGALLPLGGSEQMSGYKGYGLALLVEILSGVLSGSGLAMEVGSPLSTEGPPANVGHFFIAIDIGSFRRFPDFTADLEKLLDWLVHSPKVPGQSRIYIHGEKEFERTAEARKRGVPVLSEVVRELKTRGQSIGVPFDLEPVGAVES